MSVLKTADVSKLYLAIFERTYHANFCQFVFANLGDCSVSLS